MSVGEHPRCDARACGSSFGSAVFAAGCVPELPQGEPPMPVAAQLPRGLKEPLARTSDRRTRSRCGYSLTT